MAVTFPPNPNVGDTVTDPTTGAVWQWNGTAWVAQGMGAGGFLPLAGGTMTGPLAMNGAAATVTLSGNAAAPLQAVPLQQVEGFTGNNIGRNYLHNGAFTVTQRGLGNFTTAGAYTADRWMMYMVGDTSTVTLVGLVDADRAAIGDESAQGALLNAVTGTTAATSFTQINQRIENVHRLAGKTVTVSFYAKANTGTPQLGVSIDQLFGTGGSPSPEVDGNGQAVTLTGNAFRRYSLTFNVPSAQGKTLGSSGTDLTQLNFWFSSGANYNTRAGGIGVQSPSIVLWGVQLEVGSIATPFEHRDPEIDLALCQRFYWGGGAFNNQAYNSAGNYVVNWFAFPTSMRAVPTIVTNVTSSGNVTAANSQITATAAGVTVAAEATVTGGLYWIGTFTASADL